jgi:hypothetical protein
VAAWPAGEYRREGRPVVFTGNRVVTASRGPDFAICFENRRRKIMIRLFGVFALLVGVAGCVSAQQPYDGYGGPGYPPFTNIGIGIGGGSFGGGGIGGGVGAGVGF